MHHDVIVRRLKAMREAAEDVSTEETSHAWNSLITEMKDSNKGNSLWEVIRNSELGLLPSSTVTATDIESVR